MKRDEILNRLGFTVPDDAQVRIIVDTDAKNEADDQYAIMHHLLTPCFDVRGIIATHFESKASVSGETMELSYQEIIKVLALAEIEDVPVFRGCKLPLSSKQDLDSEGVDFIIAEARRDDNRALYIAVQGAMTNVAAALNKAPDIAKKVTVIWNGGGPYPMGRREFNLMQDQDACRVLLESEAAVWQIPQDVYAGLEVTLAELAWKVKPCGKIGEYLFRQLVEQNHKDYNPHFLLRTGENWTLGDNTVIAVLLQNRFRGNWHEIMAPRIKEDLTYEENLNGKKIRVYDSIDVRMTLEDFFAKLNLAYR